MRDWLERRSWYWFSINLSFNVFPWHWEFNWCKYAFGFTLKVGPFGIFVSWR